MHAASGPGVLGLETECVSIIEQNEFAQRALITVVGGFGLALLCEALLRPHRLTERTSGRWNTAEKQAG